MPQVVPVGFAVASYGGFITGDPEQMFITLGLSITGISDINDTAHELFDAWVTTMQADYCNDFSMFSCTVKAGPVGVGPQGEWTEPGIAGGWPGPCVPPNCSFLVKKVTGFSGRENRGRFYIPALHDRTAVGSDGTIAGSDQTAIQDALDAWYASFGTLTDPVTPVVLHSSAALPTNIESFRLEGKIATQRRRLRP